MSKGVRGSGGVTVTGGIDYSKWDHLEDSDSDANSDADADADEEQQRRPVEPRVTRLDAPSRITTTPDGTLLVEAQDCEKQKQKQRQAQPPNILPVISSQKQTHLSYSNNALSESMPIESNVNSNCNTNITIHNNNNAATATNQLQLHDSTLEHESSWTENGGAYVPSYGLYWSQDRYTVLLRFRLPQDAIPKTISVQWRGMIYSYKDRQSAVGSNNTASFQILHNSGQVLVHGDLPHPIHYNERNDNGNDDDDEDEMDWEIVHDKVGRKYVLLTLPKAVPMAGMTIRWKRPLQQVDLVEDDATSSARTTDNPFQQAWEEAHTMFREKMARGEIPRRTNHA